jgi:hypothetical protein
MLMRYPGLFGFAALVLWGGACDNGQPPPQPTLREIEYAVASRIGDALTDDEASFGRVSGLALDRNARVYVADYQNHHVKVFSPDGKFLFAVGREGAGPGEMANPCCAAIDPQGQLWVRDGGNRRYSVYSIGDTNAVFQHQIRMAHSDENRFAAVTFDAQGRVIDIGARAAPQGQPATHRMTLAADGSVAQDITVPDVPPESTGVKLIERTLPVGKVILFAYPPYGPSAMVAHAPNGEWAHGLSSRYVIDWRQADGSLIRTVHGDVTEGPPLTAEEKSRAEKNLVNDQKRFGTNPGFSVPARKQPLRGIFFDSSGRLWVQLSAEQNAPQRADIYNRNGERVARAHWPVGTDLSWGVIRGDTVWGVATDSLGVNTIVRLTPNTRR